MNLSNIYDYNIGPDVCGAPREIGEVVYSILPIFSQAYQLLDGSVINIGDLKYQRFRNLIRTLYSIGTYSNLFTTEEEWQLSVETYGVCGKFVWDEELNQVRIPKITGFLEGTLDPSAVGELVEAGLPNIEGNVLGCAARENNTTGRAFSSASGAFSVSGSGLGSNGGMLGNANANIYFSANNSNSIYGNSETVQPQSIKGYMYLVVIPIADYRGFSVPTGTSLPYRGKLVPPGYLWEDGSEISRQTYSDLFQVIGTTYGEGDGTTTFNLPDSRARFDEGASNYDEIGVKREPGLPNITGTAGGDEFPNSLTTLTGAFYDAGSSADTGVGNTQDSSVLGFDASRSNPIYGNSETVQPSSLVCLKIIKY